MAKMIGVDLGGSWVRVGVFEPGPGGGTLHVDKHASPGGWDNFVSILAPYSTAEIEGVGIAIAGPIENHSLVLKGPNLHWLDGRDVGRELGGMLGKRVVISNDMEAATEGEMARGVLRNYRWAIFDTISTGWGGNLVLDGRRIDGEPGHANAVLHSPFRCGCGNYGCHEALYSGSAMVRRIREHLPELDANAKVWEPFQAAFLSETPWAIALLDEWGEGVGRAWANVMNHIRPIQAVVYMGTTAETLIGVPRVNSRLRETMRRICIFPEHKVESFPLLNATEPNRAIYGAIAVYDKTR